MKRRCPSCGGTSLTYTAGKSVRPGTPSETSNGEPEAVAVLMCDACSAFVGVLTFDEVIHRLNEQQLAL